MRTTGLRTMITGFTLACALSSPDRASPNKKSPVTRGWAIELAEAFVREQGYTAEPPLWERIEPQEGDVVVAALDGGIDRASIASLRHDELEPRAYGTVTMNRSRDIAHVVVFRCSALAAPRFTEGCRRHGAAIVIRRDGTAYRRHPGVALAEVQPLSR